MGKCDHLEDVNAHYGKITDFRGKTHTQYEKDFPVGAPIRKKLTNRLWGMYRRCYDPRMIGYSAYGGRGIKVEPPWYDEDSRTLNPREFILWAVVNGWKDDRNIHIDRINPNGNYSPNNCRIISAKENQRNRRDNVRIELNGETKCLKAWAEELGVNYASLKNRHHLKWDKVDIVRQPIAEHEKSITWDDGCGEHTESMAYWARKAGIPYDVFRDRFNRGWSMEKVMATPKGIGHSTQFEMNGQTKNLKVWAKEYGLNYSTLKHRIQMGWDVKEAIITPSIGVGKHRK